MAVISGFTLLTVLAGVCILGVIAVIVALMCYFLIYNNNINKNIGEESGKKRKMIPPYVVAIILGVILLIVVVVGTIVAAIVGIISFRYINEEKVDVTYEHDYISPKYDIEFVGPEDIEEELTIEALRASDGYEEVVETEGDFEFVCFLNNFTCDIEDIEEPEFLIYINYLGEGSIQYFGYDIKIREFENTTEYGTGTGISDLELDESAIIVGNIEGTSVLEVTVSYIIKDGEAPSSVQEETVILKIP